jgi:hypothetical protein
MEDRMTRYQFLRALRRLIWQHMATHKTIMGRQEGGYKTFYVWLEDDSYFQVTIGKLW